MSYIRERNGRFQLIEKIRDGTGKWVQVLICNMERFSNPKAALAGFERERPVIEAAISDCENWPKTHDGLLRQHRVLLAQARDRLHELQDKIATLQDFLEIEE